MKASAACQTPPDRLYPIDSVQYGSHPHKYLESSQPISHFVFDIAGTESYHGRNSL